MEPYDIERFETRIDSQAGGSRGHRGGFEFDRIRLQKLGVVLGLTVACWMPILSLVVWLAR